MAFPAVAAEAFVLFLDEKNQNTERSDLMNTLKKQTTSE
jgi:hypothetical protein